MASDQAFRVAVTLEASNASFEVKMEEAMLAVVG